MKFFRLPRTSRNGSRSLLSGERLKLVLLAFFLFILSFLASLYIFFPTGALRDRIESEVRTHTPVDLQIRRLDLHFPLTLKGGDLMLRGDFPGRQSLEIPSAALKPAWSTLAGGNPGISFGADLMGGHIEGTARRRGDIQTHLSGIRFSEPLMTGSALTAAGTLAEGNFDGALPLRNETQTELDLRLEQVRLEGLEEIGMNTNEVALGTVRLRASGKGNALKVDEFSASGGDLEASGGGTILVFEPIDRSRINLNLELRPAASMDPDLKEMLDLFLKPSRDGASRLRITGTLASPRVR